MTTEDISSQPTVSARVTILALAIAISLPSLVAFTCSVLLSGQKIVLVAYAIGKALQLGFPLFWVLMIERRSIQIVKPQSPGLATGGFYGLMAVAVTLTVYYGLVRGNVSLGDVPDVVRYKLGAYGVTTGFDFLWLGFYYALPHTLAEEYFWRWFVHGRIRRLVSAKNAIVISSVVFALHHILLAYRYLGDAWGLVALFAIGVTISGMVWAWLYEKTNALYASWLSHLIVDAGLVWMGYEFWRS